MARWTEEQLDIMRQIDERNRRNLIAALQSDQRQAELFGGKILALFVAACVALILFVVIFGEPVNSPISSTGAKAKQEKTSQADESYEPTIVTSRLFPGSIPIGGGMGLF